MLFRGLRNHAVFAALFLLGALPAGAAEPGCGPTVRLDSKGGTMEHVPVLDQGHWGICYAAAASQMADAYWKSHGEVSPRFQSSMLEGAIGSWAARGGTVYAALEVGGGPCDVIDYYQQSGACSAQVTSRSGTLLDQEFDFLYKSYAFQAQDQPALKEKVMNRIHRLLRNQSCTPYEANVEKLAATRAQLIGVLQSITHRAADQTEADLEGSCKRAGRTPPLHASCHDSPALAPANAEKTRQFISSYFTSDKIQPLAIGYCSNVLKAGDRYVGLAAEPGSGVAKEKADCGNHESLLIGKRTDPRTGKCQFLLQNSWGTDCDNYSRDWRCKKGKIWIDADALTRNIEDYSYIQ